jgi:hypothetical protein
MKKKKNTSNVLLKINKNINIKTFINFSKKIDNFAKNQIN